eukprot:9138225-Prorocentrum_lima.AAC.1
MHCLSLISRVSARRRKSCEVRTQSERSGPGKPARHVRGRSWMEASAVLPRERARPQGPSLPGGLSV